jgi:bifunctional DNA-binding transcriptional regulator/antitoxin component of YhaV-PrlF toxin-antitoxin module
VVTIPIEFISKLGIEEGTFLEIEEQRGAIVMRPASRLKGRKAVGKRDHKRLIHDLEELRRNWH